MSNASAAATYQKLQEGFKTQALVDTGAPIIRLPRPRKSVLAVPCVKTRSEVLAEIRQDKLKIRKQQINSTLEIIGGLNELGILAGISVARTLVKWSVYAVLVAVALVIAFVIHAVCPILFWILLILVLCGIFAPTVQDQAAGQIALMDEIKKQLDARK